MGCPLCKDRAPPAVLDIFARKTSASLRSSQVAAARRGQSGVQNVAFQPAQQIQHTTSPDEEPPLFILSGQPALVHPVPPKKAPRTSGWKDVTLTTADKSTEAPIRPPRKYNKKTQTPKYMSTNNLLETPSMDRTPSSNSLSQNLGLPEETVQRLEEYMKKNQSFSSLQILMSQLQSQSSYTSSLGSSTSEEDNFGGSPAPGEEEEIKKICPLPPVVPIRKRRSIESKQPPSIPPPPPPLDDSSQDSEVSSEHESIILQEGWNQPTNKGLSNGLAKLTSQPPPSPIRTPTSPTRISPFIGRLTSVDENNSRPGTPGPWFDRGSQNIPASPLLKQSMKNFVIGNYEEREIQPKIENQVTPPPSENEESDNEMPQEITHSVLLKILQQCSDDFGDNKMVTRRASIMPSNISLDGLHEFINNFQKVEEDEETVSNTPSIGELRSALADLLENEKEFEKEQKINSSLSPSSSSLSLHKPIDKK